MAPRTLTELEEELKRDPRSRRFFDLAREYQKLGRIEAGPGASAKRAWPSYPNHWQARLLLSQIYVTKGKLDDGRQMVEKVLLALHDSVPANHLAAEIYWATGDRDKALKHYQIVDLLQPGQAGVTERIADLQAPLRRRLPQTSQPLPAQPVQEFEPLDDSPAVPPLHVQRQRNRSRSLPPFRRRSRRSGPPSTRFSPPAIPEAPSPGEPEAPWMESESARLGIGRRHRQFLQRPGAGGRGPEDAGTCARLVAAVSSQGASSGGRCIPGGLTRRNGPALQDQAGIVETAPGLNTFTLAELYEKQGYPEKAVEIYQRMLLHQPDNPAIHGRIRDLMARMAGEAPEAPAVHQEDVEKAMRHKRVLVLQGLVAPRPGGTSCLSRSFGTWN